MPQHPTDRARRTEDGDTNDEQQHAGTHTPLDEPADAAERERADTDRTAADGQHVTMPRRRKDDAPAGD